MPVVNFERWTCPITGGTVETETGVTPAGWVVLNGNWYGPLSVVVIAQRVIANPLQSIEELRAPATADELAAARALVAAAVQQQGLAADPDLVRGLTEGEQHD